MGFSGIALEAWSAQMQVMAWRDYEVATWRAGNGPALLLIHGFPTASWDWASLWPRLSERFSLHAADMLGYGLSSKPRGHDYPIAEQADLQHALLRAHGVREAHLLVHDYGVTVAQELLARQHEGSLEGLTIKSACFLNGGLFPDAHRPRPIQKLMAGPLGPLVARLMTKNGFRRSLSDVFGPDTPPTEGDIDGFWRLISHRHGQLAMPRLLSYMAQRRAHADRWVGALRQASIPMRLINGALDPVSGRHLADAYRANVPNADVVMLDHVGHYPQVEDPEAVFRAFIAFHDGLS